MFQSRSSQTDISVMSPPIGPPAIITEERPWLLLMLYYTLFHFALFHSTFLKSDFDFSHIFCCYPFPYILKAKKFAEPLFQ